MINKKQLLIFLIIMSFFILFGCTEKNDNLNENESFQNETTTNELSEVNKNNSIVNQPESNEKNWASLVDGCEHCSYSLGVCTYDSGCLYKLASSTEDCKEIHSRVAYSSKKFEVFEDRCIAQIAIDQNSIDLCKKAKTKIGDCASFVNLSVNDFTFCDTIDGLKLYNYSTKQCYLDIAKNDSNFEVKKCDEIFGLEYNECYKQVAIAQNNLSICSKLSNDLEKQKCQDEYVLKNRINDVLLCNIFSNSGACARDVLAELGEEVTKNQCKQLRDEVEGAGHDTYSNCFNLVALRDLDLDSCDQIAENNTVNKYLKTECINKVEHVLGVN